MLTLVIGLAIFIGVHLVPTNPAVREALRKRFGATAYQIGFSVVSLIGLVVLIYGFGKVQALPGKNPQLWYPPVWTKHLAYAAMLPALILLVAAYVPSRIRDVVGHPMLLAIKIWALAHLIANGRLAHLVLFGALLAWAVYDLISAKKRNARGPLGAKSGTLKGDLIAIVVGTVLYGWLLMGGHGALIGIPLIR